MQQTELVKLTRLWRHYLANDHSSLGWPVGHNQITLTSSPANHRPVAQLPISFQATPFNIRVKDSTFFAASALACLSLPALFGETAQITTICPTYGLEIKITVTQDGITTSDPMDCVLSVMVPGKRPGSVYDSIIRSMDLANHLMRFFSSAAAASVWLVAYPGVTILAMDDAWQLAMALFFYEEIGEGGE